MLSQMLSRMLSQDCAGLACTPHLPTLVPVTSRAYSNPRINEQDPILIVKPGPLSQILSRKKTIEVRDRQCTSKIGKIVWLCASVNGDRTRSGD